MAHYAILDENSIVVSVFVGRDENDGGTDWEGYYAKSAGLPSWRVRRTSFHTVNGIHQAGGTPFRQNYAGIGYRFDASHLPDGAFWPPA